MTNIDWKKTSKTDGPWESEGFGLWHRFLNWQKGLNAVLSPHGLTQPQFSILAVTGWLTRNGDLVTQTDISEFTAMRRMHISQVVRKLERLKLVTRRTSDSDGRAQNISLTQLGADKLEVTLPLVEKSDEAFFRPLHSHD